MIEPRKPSLRMDVLAWCLRMWEYVRESRVSVGPGLRLSRTSSGTIISLEGRRKGSGGKLPPFHVILKTEGTGEELSYSVNVADGWVNERIPGVQSPPSNATAVHKPFNILWGDDATAPDLPTDRRKFPLSVGQQVSVLVNVVAEGQVGLPDDHPPETLGPTEIAIEEEDTDSVHWVPPCADDAEGSGGVFHYKLAVLRAADATHPTPWLEYFLSGSHIDHYGAFLLENAANPGPAGSARVLKEYDEQANKYVFRLIKKGGQLKVNEESDGIEIRGNEVSKWAEWKDEGASTGDKLEWDDGLMTTNENKTILLPVVVAGEGIDVAIAPGTTKTYVVSETIGDYFTGDCLIRDCDGDPGADPPVPASILLRFSINKGKIEAINAPIASRPLHENVEETNVQSCCWIDDPAIDDWRGGGA
jgi:hypothetical protein